MTKLRTMTRLGLTGIAVAVFTGAPAQADTPADRFVAALENDPRLPVEAKALVRKTWTDCKNCDGEEFLTGGLAVLSEKFRVGLEAYDAGEYENCITVMGELRDDRNPFLASHAAVYEIKGLVGMERLLEAGQKIDRLLDGKAVAAGPIAEYSYFAPEVTFLHGFCLLSDLQYEAADRALSEFIERYPDASQRLVIAAKQMLAELKTREPERIGEVVDLMNYSGRRLKVGDAGETVQTRQERIIELLNKLIEEAEQNEQNSNSSSNPDGSGSQGGAAPSNPMQQSQLPGGAAEGPLRDRRRANPGEVWGAMPPAERERILQALRDNFPSRYRRLVEQYYEELAKKP